MNSGKGYGGPTSFLFYLLSSLNRERFTPSVAFYFYDAGPDIDRIRTIGVPIYFLDPKQDPDRYVAVKWLLSESRSKFVQFSKVVLKSLLKMATVDIPACLKLRRLIRQKKIHAVVLNNDVHYHVAGVLGTKLAGVPCICRKAGGIGEGKLYKKYLTPLVSLFIAVSRATEEDQRMNNPGTKKLAFVHEGIDLNLFAVPQKHLGLKAQLGIPESRKIVMNVSRLVAGKGHWELLDAAARVIKEYPEVVFVIVGDGLMMDALKERAGQLRLSNHLIFTGWRNDAPAVLSIADIFVHCPTSCLEGLGIANLEAMAMRKPTIVSANGGLPDAVIDGVTGYIVPPGDDRKLAAAIIRLLKDERLAEQLGENARKRVETYFDIRKNARRLEGLFATTVETNL